MRRTMVILITASVLVSAGCQNPAVSDTWLDDSRLHLDESNVETGDNVELTAEWAEVSPGIWERWRFDGGFERMGFGIEGLQFALEQARQERIELLAGVHEWSVSDLNDRLRSNQELIGYLQGSLDEAKQSGLREELPLEPPAFDEVADSSSVSDYVCGGTYTFDINFIYTMTEGWVDTVAGWSEFGPYAPYKKTLYTYAYAWTYDGGISPREDEDSVGPFSYSCCTVIQSGAGVEPTFNPMLYGRAYVSVTNGCSAFRFHEFANY